MRRFIHFVWRRLWPSHYFAHNYVRAVRPMVRAEKEMPTELPESLIAEIRRSINEALKP